MYMYRLSVNIKCEHTLSQSCGRCSAASVMPECNLRCAAAATLARPSNFATLPEGAGWAYFRGGSITELTFMVRRFEAKSGSEDSLGLFGVQSRKISRQILSKF